MRAEIVERLGLRDPEIVLRGFARPNLELAVDASTRRATRTRRCSTRSPRPAEPGIVYAATRRRTEELAAALRERGVEAVAYHAGLQGCRRARPCRSASWPRSPT